MSASNSELDPHFIKALGYLFSKSPDATTKLQKMLDDAIQQSMKKKQDSRGIVDKSSTAIKNAKHPVKLGKTAHDLKSKKEKDLAQKRQLEKIQKDLEELNQDVAKKARYEASSPTAFLSSSDVKVRSDSRKSSTEKGTPVECHECHNLYHRECHQPTISRQETNDPRCVWYCSWCQKSMKKVAKQFNSKSSQAIHSNHVLERVSSPDSKPAFVNMFKRHEMKTTLPATGNGASGGSLAGWAALSGKSVPAGSVSSKSQVPLKAHSPHASSPKHPASSASHFKDKLNSKGSKIKAGQKFAVSDDLTFAKALGADIPSSGSLKSASKPNWSGGSAKSSLFPKATAVSSNSSKAGSLPSANAEKRLQIMKKKAKSSTKRTKS